MTSHELANELLALPDCPVVGEVELGGCRNVEADYLEKVGYEEKYHVVSLRFTDGECHGCGCIST